MAQFDVYKNSNSATNKTYPYVLDVQNNLLDSLATRVVVPLASEKKVGTPMARLNPCFEIEGKRVVMSTAELAGVSKQSLGKKVASLISRRNEILGALDFVITGF